MTWFQMKYFNHVYFVFTLVTLGHTKNPVLMLLWKPSDLQTAGFGSPSYTNNPEVSICFAASESGLD